ncbi:tol-pal system-associated acyl-CoA thioesterase [Halomonas denitrificans]|nr:tol-pal system-associated acyl-CoA thioesterase [Halomonas denitrificans]
MTGPDPAARNPSFRYRVYWEDTDAGGVVYHARYLQFLERARSDWLASIGVHQVPLRERHGVVFAITKMAIDFRKPARLEDELSVTVAVIAIGRLRMDFEQRIERDGELLLTATVQAACLDAERFAPKRTPAEVRERILAAAGAMTPAERGTRD